MTDRLPIILAGVMMLAAALMGGASRATEVMQMPLRIVAIIVLVVALWSPHAVRLARYRTLLVFGGACAAVAAVQLIPLPGGLWSALPGRGFYAELSRQVGIGDVARPLSFAPELTLHALLALLVPAAMLVAVASMPVARLGALVWALLGVMLVGLLLGYAQMGGGPTSALRMYAITNRDAMVGLFANRNHHGLMLAMALPILFALAGLSRHHKAWRTGGPLLCLAGCALVAVTLLLTGSRAGLLVGAAGALAGATLYAVVATPSRRGGGKGDSLDPPPASRQIRGPVIIVGAVAAIIAILGVVFARLPAMQRLLHADAAEEVRFQLFWPTVELAWAMFPLGGGIGAFDQLFRRFEPDQFLRVTYQNQAHMEPLQVMIESGLPGLILLGLALWWWLQRTRAAWRLPKPITLTESLPRLGSILVLLPMLASLGDYPLRTPLHASMLMIAAVWLELGERAYQSGRLRRR